MSDSGHAQHRSFTLWLLNQYFVLRIPSHILGDPGADSGDEGKSKRAENVARRKVKNGEKSPWGQCLTRPVPTVAAVLASDWCQKTFSEKKVTFTQNN